MRAQIEVFWLNSVSYRTDIRSRDFSQTRIVNGRIVEEHDTGDFYPRWIQNFVEAILEPIPRVDQLRKVPGSVPIGVQEHACISSDSAQICFQDAEPRIATGSGPSRSIWFDDFAPFGQKQIARTLVDNLPGNLLLRGHIVLLSPLSLSDYPLLKAREYTPDEKLIRTELVSQSTADSLIQMDAAGFEGSLHSIAVERGAARLGTPVAQSSVGESPVIVHIRTDRTGRVREAYAEGSGEGLAQDAALIRALALRFKPLIVGGVPRQMEAAISVP